MSKRAADKKARRRKRRAVRDQHRVPAPARDHLAEQFEIADELRDFERRLLARGWEITEDPDDEVGIAWYWPPSFAEVQDPSQQVTATVVLLTPDDGGEVAHVVFVGTSLDYQFGLEELFDHIDVLEAHRLGEPLPLFGG